MSAAAIGFFERWLTLWALLCIVAGIALGELASGPVRALGALEVAKVNIPVGLLIWVMIVPMLLRIDFGAMGRVRQHWPRVSDAEQHPAQVLAALKGDR